MDLNFNMSKARDYTSNSQIARVLTENWVQSNGYCPNCGCDRLDAFKNNMPVADFYCDACSEQFELKSKGAETVGCKIVDGAYKTMIERIQSDNNPHFFFLTYNKNTWSVNNFLIIPKHYFTSKIIEKRNPLKATARRAGWVGCNIDLTRVPSNGHIYIVQNGRSIKKDIVQSKWQSTSFLKQQKGEARGWTLDVMNCIDAIQGDTFTIKDIYAFEEKLKVLYPSNNFIKDKIRQQLQLLRDKGLIIFKSRGIYEKVKL